MPAVAQEFSHSTAIGLGYSSVDVQGLTADGFSLEGESVLRFGRVSTKVDLGWNQLEDNGGELTQMAFHVAPTYWVSQNFGLGAYIAKDNLDLGGGLDTDLNSYGVEGTLRFGRFEGAAFHGETEIDNLANIVEVKDTGLRMRADLGQNVSVWGSGVWSNIDIAGLGDVDARSLGAGANMAFGSGFDAFVSYQMSAIDNTGLDSDTKAVGLSYTTNLGTQSVVFSGEYASATGRSPIGSLDGDRFSMGATLLLGDARAKRTPAHTVSNSVVRGERSAITGLTGSIGF
ncbi:hypothetical protein [Pseudoponticoccus marisrubri]|uniref:Porin domain-containing protein n=1 Tax=Pseudoponticoccus marisrubri TaxID=1685382 RepID=A0A0W7WGL2_9RHOB|nr:hypothetical protein [Pseudoponticoccus marisrubri]KUF09787.1 hypothetical protein AVJ23_15155 [Pseudoponticoccus marisrubri]